MKKLFLFILIPFLQVFSQSEYYDALENFQNEEYAKAYRLFESFLSNRVPEDEFYAYAKFYSAEALYNLGEYAGAVAGYEFLINRYEYSNFREEAMLRLGYLYGYLGDFEKSREILQRFNINYPNNPRYGTAYYYIGDAFYRQGMYAEALEYFRDAEQHLRFNTLKAETFYSIGNCYEKLGEYQKAVDYYEKVLSFFKESEMYKLAQLRIGIAYFLMGEFDFTIIELADPRFAKNDLKDDIDVMFFLADAHYRVGETEYAIKLLQNIKDKFPAEMVSRDVTFALGWCYLQQREYANAYDNFTTLSGGADSLAIEARYWSGEIKRYLGEEEVAIKIFEEFVKDYPESKFTPGAKYQLALVFYASKAFNSAKNYLIDASNSFDSDIRIKSNLILGEIYLNTTKYDSAYIRFDLAMKESKQNSGYLKRGMLGKGAALYYSGKLEDAETEFLNLEYLDPRFETHKVSLFQGEINFKKEDFKKALRYYKKVSPRLEPEANAALYGSAYSLFNLRDYESAKFAFEDFTNKYPADPKIVDAKLRLAESYFANREFSKSTAIYNSLKAEKNFKDGDYVVYQYALSLFNQGKSKEAITEFRVLVSNFPSSPYVENSRYLIGWIYFQEANYEQAISEFTLLLNRTKNKNLLPVIYYSLGDSYFNLAQHDTAIYFYRVILNEYPTSQQVGDALNGIQYCYFALGESEKAVTVIDDFLRSHPGVENADKIFLKKGELYYSQGDYRKAADSYFEFLNNFPGSQSTADAFYWLGKSYQMMGDLQNALSNLNICFERYPESEASFLAAVESSIILRKEKRYDEALRLLEKAIDRFKENQRVPELLFMKALVFIDLDDKGNAADALDEIIYYYIESVFADKARIEKGKIEIEFSRYDRAIELFQRVVSSRTDEIAAEAQYLQGVALFKSEQFNQAITALVRVKSMFGRFEEWVIKSELVLSDCYLATGDKKKAREILNSIIKKYPDDDAAKEARTKLRNIK